MYWLKRGSGVVFLVQGQHIQQSTSIGNMLAKSLFCIFLIHWWTCWPSHWWTYWPSSHWWTSLPRHWWTYWRDTGEYFGKVTVELIAWVTGEHVGLVTVWAYMLSIHVVWVTGEQVVLVTGEEVGLIFAFFPFYKFHKFMKIYQ